MMLEAEGRRAEADALVSELFALEERLGPSLITGFGTGLAEFGMARAGPRTSSELLVVLNAAPRVPWVSAAHAIATGDFERAIAAQSAIGASTAEAYVRLRAAAELATTGHADDAERHLNDALAFYVNVGATRFIDACERVRASLGNSTGRARSVSP